MTIFGVKSFLEFVALIREVLMKIYRITVCRCQYVMWIFCIWLGLICVGWIQIIYLLFLQIKLILLIIENILFNFSLGGLEIFEEFNLFYVN